MHLLTVNILAIVIAAVAAWIFGAAYYGALGKQWVAALGTSMDALKAQNAGKSSVAKASPFVLSFVAELIMAFVLWGIVFHVGTFSIRSGIISGVVCWLGFVLTTIATNNAYPGRKVMLTVIDAGHWLGALAIIGAIIGGFGPR
jgi:Protein of unknown function (DUF1761)